eukprot:TRINITY_DN44968_c0_g1_i11.p1 TRINITY_DN44968_c0_g1~~TRINITY_DN44968_c0_g1_i11.p1  ORF type:complete len:114 (-),score=16.56 TRINITY_DN44968_c0_g1_i11:37-378(-)
MMGFEAPVRKLEEGRVAYKRPKKAIETEEKERKESKSTLHPQYSFTEDSNGTDAAVTLVNVMFTDTKAPRLTVYTFIYFAIMGSNAQVNQETSQRLSACQHWHFWLFSSSIEQ